MLFTGIQVVHKHCIIITHFCFLKPKKRLKTPLKLYWYKNCHIISELKNINLTKTELQLDES